MNDITGKGDDGAGGIMGLVLLWILFGAFLLLIISPVDLIPEITGPVGFIDDIVYGIVDLLIGALIYTQTKRRKKVKHGAGEKDVTPEAKELPEGEEAPELPKAVETEEREGPKEP
jgi:uncharacterized membrane protein YkvA (DUF1232 family)